MKRNGKGKPEFSATNEMYVDISADQASVGNVTSKMRKCWGDTYTLMTNDGNEIEDCETTQGKKNYNISTALVSYLDLNPLS